MCFYQSTQTMLRKYLRSHELHLWHFVVRFSISVNVLLAHFLHLYFSSESLQRLTLWYPWKHGRKGQRPWGAVLPMHPYNIRILYEQFRDLTYREGILRNTNQHSPYCHSVQWKGGNMLEGKPAKSTKGSLAVRRCCRDDLAWCPHSNWPDNKQSIYFTNKSFQISFKIRLNFHTLQQLHVTHRGKKGYLTNDLYACTLNI